MSPSAPSTSPEAATAEFDFRKATPERLAEARRRMGEAGIDVLFVGASSTLFYLTGGPNHRSERLLALLLPRDGDPLMICPAFEETRVRLSTGIERVVAWAEDEPPYRKLAEHLKVPAGTVLGIEPTTAYEDAVRLLDALAGTRAVNAAFLTHMRMIKNRAELDAMRSSIAIAAGRFARTFAALRPGVTEKEMATHFGGENMVQFGPNSALPHGAPTSRTLAPNQAVLIDAWDAPSGYYYDITRSTFFGKPTDRYRQIWDIVLEAQGAAIEAARPGVFCQQVDAAARGVIEKAGFGRYFTHRLGHGLGIDVHEEPYMVRGNDLRLEAGMTFTSEPGIYVEGEFGVRIEDDIVVTEKGAESLSPRINRLESISA
jgi:Xaa-Pro aminopeptidase